ncbi:MAG TPA: O-antigen ligase family protein [Candidatus Paceibacterota bacterium]|nr:O-antigen ligase family protein [Candidatus Paceibacterota bacterium]
MYIVCLIFTVSRGAFLSIGVTGLFLLISLIINPNHSLNHWLKIDTQKIGIIILLIACSIVFCMFAFKNTSLLRNNHLVNRLTTFNLSDGSSLSRIFVTKIGINCFLQRPLLGYGFDNFEICFQKNFEPIITNVVPEQSRFDKAHNMPIEIMATTGIFGIIFFLGIYFFAYKNIRDLMLSDNIDFYAGLSLILGIVAYFIQNLFMFDIFEGFISLIVLLGFIIVLKNENKININIPKN